MTDVITLPSGVEVYEGKVLVIPGIGVVMPIGDLTPAEVQALREDVVAAFNQALGDLVNVSESGKTEGMVLGVNAGGTWEPQELIGKIEALYTNWNSNSRPNISSLSVGPGIDVNTGVTPAHRGHLQLVWGASGTDDVVARADHRHPPTLIGRPTFDKDGAVLGAGTNTLVDTTVTGLVPSAIYDVAVTGKIEAVNTNQSGRLNLYVRIAGGPSFLSPAGFSGGVWTQAIADGYRMQVSGVTSCQLEFWATYASGDPTALYTGSLQYALSPRGGTT